MVIVVANEKGGTGKTTCAVGIATALARRRRIVLVDTDAQQSAAAWLDGTENVEVVPHQQAPGLGAFLEQQAARPDVDLVICDTPPGLPAQLREAVKVADVILIPVRPSGPDFAALRSTLELVKILARQTVEVRIIISQAMPGTVMAKGAREAAAQYGAEVCRAVVYNRIAHAEAATAGRPIFQYAPESLAAVEMDQLAREVWRDAREPAR